MPQLLTKQAEENGDSPFVLDPTTNTRYTFRRIHELTRNTAASLIARGIEPNSRVGLALNPRPIVTPLYFASVRLGLTLIMLDPDATAEDLNRKRAETQFDRLIGDPSRRDRVPSDLEFIPAGNLPDGSGDDPGVSRSGDHRLIVFTSGSTGTPKAVRLTWDNMLSSARASADRLGVDPADWWLSPLGVHHVGGLAPIVRSLLNGTRVTTIPYNTKSILERLDNRTITGVSLVPVMLRKLLEETGTFPTDDLRFILLGGAPTPPELRERAAARNLPIHVTYGMTETASQIATAEPDEALKYPEAVGRPLEGVTVTILGEDDTVRTPGNAGEIVVDGPMVCEGYDNRPDLNRTRFGDWGFHTGDRGRLDDSGRLTIEGRIDRRFLSGGHTVDPALVEEVLESHDAILKARVLGVEDPDWGNRVCAAVRTDPDESVSASELRAELEEHLPEGHLPRAITEVEDFPRTESGSVDDGELAREFSGTE